MFTFKKLARAKTKAKHAIGMGIIRFLCREMDMVRAIQFLKKIGNSVAETIAASDRPEASKRRAFKRIRRIILREIRMNYNRHSKAMVAPLVANGQQR